MNLSVIIPVYNEVKTINQIINKVLNVKTRYKEIIIVDDCSTDASVKIIEAYNSNKIKLVKHDRNLGISHSLNSGLKVAQGDFLSFFAGDDVFYQDRLQSQYKAYDEIGNYLLFSSPILFNSSKNKVEDTQKSFNLRHKEVLGNPSLIFESLFTRGNFICASSGFCHRSILENFLYDTRLHQLQDYDLWLKLAIQDKIRFHNSPVCLYRFNEQGNGVSKPSLAVNNRSFMEAQIIFDKLFATEPTEIFKCLGLEKNDFLQLSKKAESIELKYWALRKQYDFTAQNAPAKATKELIYHPNHTEYEIRSKQIFQQETSVKSQIKKLVKLILSR